MIELEPNLNKLPDAIKAKIAKRSRDKGSNYERDVAKKIAAHFGKPWGEMFFRTKPHGMAQPNGDIQPINEMNDLWRVAKLGPLECKNRLEWSWDNLFRDPKNSYLYKYWEKSNKDTGKNNTVLIFTKNGVTDYVMTNEMPCNPLASRTLFFVEQEFFIIQTLKDFLNHFWPQN